MVRHKILSIISSLLILLWTYASLSKLLDYEQSRSEMQNQVFSMGFAQVLTWLVPLVELGTALLLCFGRTLKTGLYISTVLLFSFTGYIILVMTNVFGRIPCSCGGIIQQLNWNQHMVFNLVFLAIAVTGNSILKQTKTGQNAESPATFNTPV